MGCRGLCHCGEAMTTCNRFVPVQKKKKAGGGGAGGGGGAQPPQLDPAARKEGERRFQVSMPAACCFADARARGQLPSQLTRRCPPQLPAYRPAVPPTN